MGEIQFIAFSCYAAGLVVVFIWAFWPFKARTPPTLVSLRMPSNRTTGGKFWTAVVTYDAWGSPYAKAHDGLQVILYKGGSTGDGATYGTQWKHLSGTPVRFPDAETASESPRTPL